MGSCLQVGNTTKSYTKKTKKNVSNECMFTRTRTEWKKIHPMQIKLKITVDTHLKCKLYKSCFFPTNEVPVLNVCRMRCVCV